MVGQTLSTQVQVGGETTYGTETSSYTEVPRVQSVSFNGRWQINYDAGLGEGHNVQSATYAYYLLDGVVRCALIDFDFLKYWIGPKSGAGTSGDPYILTEASKVDTSTSYLQPFSIEAYNPSFNTARAQYAVGCVGDSFTLTASKGQKLLFEGNFSGRYDGLRTSGETYTAVTTAALTLLGGTIKWGDTPSAITGMQSFTLSYNNGLIKGVDTMDITDMYQGIPGLGLRVYTWEATFLLSDAVFTSIYADYYNNGGAYTPEDGTDTVSPAANKELKIELVNSSREGAIWLDQCTIDDISRDDSLGGGLVTATFRGRAFYAKGNSPFRWWTS